jgi:hypothetical protein
LGRLGVMAAIAEGPDVLVHVQPAGPEGLDVIDLESEANRATASARGLWPQRAAESCCRSIAILQSITAGSVVLWCSISFVFFEMRDCTWAAASFDAHHRLSLAIATYLHFALLESSVGGGLGGGVWRLSVAQLLGPDASSASASV